LEKLTGRLRGGGIFLSLEFGRIEPIQASFPQTMMAAVCKSLRSEQLLL
jgi:hypothetical protein